MPPGVRIEIDDATVRDLARRLSQASRSDRRRLTAALADVGGAVTRARIGAGGPDPDGTPWTARRPGAESAQPILNRGGYLAESITASSSAGQARWGSRKIYARIHQLGGVIRPRRARALRFMLGDAVVFARRVTIPARPYLGWGATEREEAAVVIRRWLDQAFGGATG